MKGTKRWAGVWEQGPVMLEPHLNPQRGVMEVRLKWAAGHCRLELPVTL